MFSRLQLVPVGQMLKSGKGAGIAVFLGGLLTPVSGCCREQLHPDRGSAPRPLSISLLKALWW